MVDENGRPKFVTSQRVRICYNSMFGQKLKIDKAVGNTGLCKMEQRLTKTSFELFH